MTEKVTLPFAIRAIFSVNAVGSICAILTIDTVRDTGAIARNRNGHYRVFLAEGRGSVGVKVEILREI